MPVFRHPAIHHLRCRLVRYVHRIQAAGRRRAERHVSRHAHQPHVVRARLAVFEVDARDLFRGAGIFHVVDFKPHLPRVRLRARYLILLAETRAGVQPLAVHPHAVAVRFQRAARETLQRLHVPCVPDRHALPAPFAGEEESVAIRHRLRFHRLLLHALDQLRPLRTRRETSMNSSPLFDPPTKHTSPATSMPVQLAVDG